MLLRFLGTGTSYGVPFVGCDCEVCRSTNAHNKRLRASVLVEAGDTRLLIDTGPDLRAQLLRANISQVSAIFWTHAHNDHIIGLDDVRPLSDKTGYIPGYADTDTMARLQLAFDYAFVTERDGGFPRVTGHVLEPFASVEIGPIQVTALPIAHGKRTIFAYEFACNGRRLIYATDCSGIPDESKARMKNAQLFVVDALRHTPHPGHFHLEAALEAARELSPQRALFTHIGHDLDHEVINANLPDHVRLAFDTQEVEV